MRAMLYRRGSTKGHTGDHQKIEKIGLEDRKVVGPVTEAERLKYI